MSMLSALNKPVSILSKNTNAALDNAKDTALEEAVYPIFARVGLKIEMLITETFPKLPDSSKILIYNDVMDILTNKRPQLANENEIAFAFVKYLAGLESCLDASFFSNSINSVVTSVYSASTAIQTNLAKLKKILADIDTAELTTTEVPQIQLGETNITEMEEMLKTIRAVASSGKDIFSPVSKVIERLDKHFENIYSTPAEVDSTSISDLLNECRALITKILAAIEFINIASVNLPSMKENFLAGFTSGFAVSYIADLIMTVFSERIMLDDILMSRSISSLKIINLFNAVLMDELTFRCDEVSQKEYVIPAIKKINTATLKQDLIELFSMLNQPSTISGHKSRLVSLIVGHLEKVEDKLVLVDTEDKTFPTWQLVFKSFMEPDNLDNFFNQALFGNWEDIATMTTSEADSVNDAVLLTAHLDTKFGSRGPSSRILEGMRGSSTNGMKILAGTSSDIYRRSASAQSSIKTVLEAELLTLAEKRLKVPCERLFGNIWEACGSNLHALISDTSLMDSKIKKSAANTVNSYYKITLLELNKFQSVDTMLGELGEMVQECEELYSDYWEDPVRAGADSKVQARRFLTELLRYIKSIKERHKVAQWI